MMELSAEVCQRARLSRDERFDGRFFIGVVTTGTYCRPICPVRLPKEKNVEYYPSAAAAAEAGFRPCLRCRPEFVPQSSTWMKTSATVSRALRLIASGALDQGGVNQLAEKLGVGARHLNRLFVQHLGASPLAVAKTRRLHFAKRLIDDSDLSMTEIALASGYNSIRSFNHDFKNTYQRTPSQLRKLFGYSYESTTQSGISLKIPFQAPMQWESLIEFLRFRAIPGVEYIENDQYFRTITYEGKSGWISAQPVIGKNFLQIYIAYPVTEKLFSIVEKIKTLLDLNASAKEIHEQLSQHPTLKGVVAQFPGIRIPGSWDFFEMTVRAILGQQISVKAATTLATRITNKFGIPLRIKDPQPPTALSFLFPTPEILAEADLTDLGITHSRSATIKALACAVRGGSLPYHQISLEPSMEGPSADVSEDNEAFIKQLKQIRGIGDWTANYVAMRVLREPDAFPASDLVLRKMAAQNTNAPLNTKEMLEMAESWRPWRAYATMYLWKKASLS